MRCELRTIVVGFCVLTHAFSQAQAVGRLPNRDEAQECFRQGERLLAGGMPEDAIDAFDHCLSFAPDFDEAYLQRAVAKRMTHDFQGAHTDYNIYLERVPDQAEALFGRATARFELGLYDLAKQDLTKLLNPSPAETTTVFYQLDQSGRTNRVFTAQAGMLHAVYNYLGLIAFHSTDYAQALKWYDSAILRSPQSADYFVNRALAHEALGNSHAAVGDYEHALEIDPYNSLARYNMAQAAIRAGQSAMADGYLSQAISDHPGLSYTWAERGVFRLNQNDLHGALSDLSQALTLNPDDYDTWFNRGLANQRLGLLKEAYSDFTEAIEWKPDFGKAWLSRGNVLYRLGRFADAVQDYSAAVHYHAGYAQAYYNRAIAYDHLHKDDLACQDLHDAHTFGMEIPENMRRKFCEGSDLGIRH